MKIETLAAGVLVTLTGNEPILPEHNVLGTTVVREIGSMLAIEKDADEILGEDFLG
jgi:hypothetical protein